MSVTKKFVSANQLLNDAFTLGKMVINSGFYPDLLLALWRGGTPVAVAIQELLHYHNHPHDHFAIKTRHYAGIDQRHDEVKVESLEPALKLLRPSLKVLLVDDVFDTGLSIKGVFDSLEAHSEGLDIKTAVPFYKPSNNLTNIVPDYRLHTTDQWIVFPHELAGMTKEELIAGKPELSALPEAL